MTAENYCNKKAVWIAGLFAFCSVIILFFFFTGEYTLAEESDTGEDITDQGFDGYLFELPARKDIQLFSDYLEENTDYICENVYWVQDQKTLSELERMGLVSYSEPNYVVTLFDEDPPEDNPGWPYQMMEVGYAADLGLDGSGIRIALIDSGVDLNNADLQNANIGSGYDYINDSTEMTDTYYHGTKVAQIVAADSNSYGVTGIARGAQVIPLRCFSSGSGTIREIVQAIYDAVRVYDCDIINMSWGLASSSGILYDAVQEAYNAGIILIASAGNVTSSYPQGSRIYPACYEEVIGVSAINSSYQVISSSQRHNGVLVCAPGERIPFVSATGTIIYDSGTSFSSPCITAAAAILLQLAPFLDKEAMVELLAERATDLGDEGYDTSYGYGVVSMDQVIGKRWNHFLTGELEGINYPIFQGWLVNPGGGTIVIAAYMSDERMAGCLLVTDNENILRFNEMLVTEESESVSIYYLDGDGSPIYVYDQYCFE